MHTFQGKYGTVIFHNGDYSGEVTIRDEHGNEVEVEMEELLDLVAEYIRDRAIARIEQANTDELIAHDFRFRGDR